MVDFVVVTDIFQDPSGFNRDYTGELDRDRMQTTTLATFFRFLRLELILTIFFFPE